MSETARLKADPRCRDIPVIILTATDDTVEAMDRGLRGGAVDYITKPISPPRVAVRVRAVVERRRLQRQLQELQASFTSMLVHDLRAPLTIIKGYADLFEATSGPLTAKQQRYLKSMQEQRFKDAYQYVSTTLRAGKSHQFVIPKDECVRSTAHQSDSCDRSDTDAD